MTFMASMVGVWREPGGPGQCFTFVRLAAQMWLPLAGLPARRLGYGVARVEGRGWEVGGPRAPW